ncbi:NtaA/DmoA family FMN-dependent monooxygenase [Agromyces atrinae]|uniref:FMN-dependent oxidoreductase (Nitrilotriacetate monooxygenase family) n=1 Tax=Agromyces atrinae TaxID=592376 RepID=A0A4V1R2F8_9MICO|nr:NtaA/DmoA family FMN-dependent monooxygenase [Agromyces atrinae]NYD67152.1 FMN-dependent oxidoreductase (nitrilotriacetate monooxygenase family) [Agromyces atrinae]RXZ87006.1 LLM class flavin-dependent oxidoreductase [Agromyces atrinae]
MTSSQQHDPRYPDGRIRFGVFFQGVNFHTIWTDENSGSQHDFESFRRVIQTAERGLFSAFFLGEGLRLREHLGRLHDLDIAGRPDAQTQLAALAAVTERIGLVATQNTTYNDPADLAYRLASLDLLSEGRAAWNIVTTDNAWTGANFRRGGYLAHEHRYERAAEFIDAAKALWRAWPDQHVDVAGRHVTFSTDRVLPPSSQGRPVLFQAGDSSEGRDFAAQHADVIFSAHPGLDDATTFAADVRARLLRFGRAENELAFFPGQVIILGDSATDAAEKADWVRHSQVTPQTALAYLEQIWGTDLSAYDPDGPLPDIDPVQDETNETRGSPFRAQKARELAASWRAISVEKKLSIREFVIHLTSSRGLIGSYSEVADQIREYTRRGVVQGFNISPYLVPSGLDDIVNGLVPELQERGIYPTEYESTTLREELGLPAVEAAGSVAALESA